MPRPSELMKRALADPRGVAEFGRWLDSILAIDPVTQTIVNIPSPITAHYLDTHYLKLDASNGPITGPLAIGDGTNFIRFASDGTPTLIGTATVFDDLQTPLIGAKLDSPSSHIEQNLAEGSMTFKTSCALTDYIIVVPQMTHKWKAGSAISPHLHWWQASATIPNWLIQYRWQSQGGAKVTAWTSAKYASHVYTYVSGTLNQITEFPDITPPAGYGLSDIVQFRILRDVANTSTLFSGADGLAASVEAVSFDFHVEMDRLGSSSEYTA